MVRVESVSAPVPPVAAVQNPARTARIQRTTRETDITVEVDLDAPLLANAADGGPAVDTPLPFFSHMLEQLARHGGFGLAIMAKGDTQIDGHHTVEDTGIVLGEAFAKALGDKRGIARYGWATLPMDEARVSVSLDLSGRPISCGMQSYRRRSSASSTSSLRKCSSRPSPAELRAIYM